MKINTTEEQGVKVLTITGELDGPSSPQLTQAFDQLLDGGARRFVVDLKDVTFVDSAGLSSLVRLFKRARSSNGTLWLAGLQPPVKRVFELTRLDRAFEIASDKVQALQRVAKA